MPNLVNSGKDLVILEGKNYPALRFLKVVPGFWPACAMGVKNLPVISFKNCEVFYGPLFFTSHSRTKTPPEEIPAGDFPQSGAFGIVLLVVQKYKRDTQL